MKSEKLTEYFVKYMNCVASYCNAKAQEPLYIKNNLIHKTWEFQNELIQFEKEISDEILADNVLFGSYSLLYELSYKIKDEMLGFLRDSSLDINFFDNFSSIYHHFLEVIDHYIQWNSVTEAELMQFGFCKVGVEEIFLIPYYIFSIVPETFEFVNLYGCAIKKKANPCFFSGINFGMLTIWNYVERNLVFFKILYVKNFFLQISHTYSVEVIKYSFKGFFYCIYIHVFIKGRVLPPTFWKLSSAGQSSYLINSRSWVRVP